MPIFFLSMPIFFLLTPIFFPKMDMKLLITQGKQKLCLAKHSSFGYWGGNMMDLWWTMAMYFLL